MITASAKFPVSCVLSTTVLVVAVLAMSASAHPHSQSSSHDHAHSHTHDHSLYDSNIDRSHSHSNDHTHDHSRRPSNTETCSLVPSREDSCGLNGDSLYSLSSLPLPPSLRVGASRALIQLSALTPSTLAYLSSLATALASLVGLLLLPLPASFTGALSAAFLAFAAGALLADTTQHLLPHAYAQAPDAAGHAVLAGILAFFTLDTVIASVTNGHVHSHDANEIAKNKPAADSSNNMNVSHATVTAAYLNLAADALHNFCDGLAVGAAYRVSTTAGLSTTLAVFLHEVPQELGDYMILLRAGFSRSTALASNLLCALSALVGTAASLQAATAFDGVAEHSLLPFAGGGLLYMAVGMLLLTAPIAMDAFCHSLPSLAVFKLVSYPYRLTTSHRFVPTFHLCLCSGCLARAP
jgi:zinc and cadmium transporter